MKRVKSMKEQNCHAFLHGKDAWQRCMASLHGKGALYGIFAWHLCMAKVHCKKVCIRPKLRIGPKLKYLKIFLLGIFKKKKYS